MSRVEVASTTDSQDQVNQAAIAVEGDRLVEGYETEIQSATQDGVTVATTTDTEKALQGAFKEKSHSGAQVVSTSDPPEAVAEVQKDLDEQTDERIQQYLGKPPKLVRQVHRLTGKNYRLQEENEQLRQQLSQRQTNADSESPDADGAGALPSPSPPPEFYHQQYQQAVENRRKEIAELNPVATESLAMRREEAQQRLPDMAETIGWLIEQDAVSQAAQEHIFIQPNGFDVAYYLGKNPGALLRLREIENRHGILAMGQALDGLAHDLAFHVRETQKASQSGHSRRWQNAGQREAPPPLPKPIRPVGGSYAVTVERDLNELPFPEYARIMNERERKNRR
jgi:hypothetical protein